MHATTILEQTSVRRSMIKPNCSRIKRKLTAAQLYGTQTEAPINENYNLQGYSLASNTIEAPISRPSRPSSPAPGRLLGLAEEPYGAAP